MASCKRLFMLVNDVRVLDFSTGVAGAYCTKLLADAGADVVKVEHPDGDPLRRWSASHQDLKGRDGALFEFLHTNKRSVVGDLSDQSIKRLLEAADLVVESADWFASPESVQGCNPALTVVSITPFGRTGPWSQRQATEFTLQAMCGSIALRGAPDREPLCAGGRVGEWIGGAYAAVGALGALRLARRSGIGEHVDVSLLECMSVSMHGGLIMRLATTTPQPWSRAIEVPSIERASDGVYIGITVITGQQFRDFCLLIERPELAEDLENLTPEGRRRGRDALRQSFREWTSKHTAEEILGRANLFRLPASIVAPPRDIPRHPHLVARHVFATNPTGRFIQPRRPYRVNDVPDRALTPYPRLGEHTGAIEWRPGPRAFGRTSHADEKGPLQGVRITDLTGFWAGSACTHILGALGAEVIKVESIQRPDPFRLYSERPPHSDRWWEWGTSWNYVNTNKRGVTLDLGHDRGLQLLLGLIRVSDVLVENFTPRVMDHFGLTWEMVSRINPRIIIVRMPAFGLDGPWRDLPGFAHTMEQVAGMAWVTGYSDGPPMAPGGPCDPLAGLHAAFATIAGLEERARSGRGHLIEVPMVEAALNASAELVIEFSAYGAELVRAGNRGPAAAPQGVYPCAGEDTWVAVAIETDDQWTSLRKAMGDPIWARSSDLRQVRGRREAHDLIDKEVARWCSDRDVVLVVEKLLDAGIPAAKVASPEEIPDYRQMRARRFFETVHHPVSGRRRLAGLPFRLRSCKKGWLRAAAPTLGQDNRVILGELLGLGERELADLEEQGVIGYEPTYS